MGELTDARAKEGVEVAAPFSYSLTGRNTTTHQKKLMVDIMLFISYNKHIKNI
ncbi:hypothetical protein [Paenibacillus dendrobii]|uniref:hypothetical protein n=1 Tax=Paenibacillus dendrobii TaxID=2691084 RepID=UPI001F33AAC6|nr:hypothetical protein [Paenibacillus dendrobii]